MAPACLSASTGEVRTWDISPAGPRRLGNFQVSGGLLDRLVVAADESAAYATVYTNSGDLSSVHRVDLRSGEDDEVLSDVRYYFSTRPLVSPDLSVVATLDDDYVTDAHPASRRRLDSTRALRVRARIRPERPSGGGRRDICCATSGDRSRAAPAGSSTSRPVTRCVDLARHRHLRGGLRPAW